MPLIKQILYFLPFILCAQVLGQQTLASYQVRASQLPHEREVQVGAGVYVSAIIDPGADDNALITEIIDPLTGKVWNRQARIDFEGAIKVRIRSRYGNAPAGSIRVKVTSQPVADYLEPNDQLAQAADIHPWAWYQTEAYPADDVDHFRFELDGNYWVDADFGIGTPQVSYWITTPDGNSVAGSYPVSLAAGSYFLKIAPRNVQDTPVNFAFRVKVEAPTDRYEPNDETPARIAIDEYVVMAFQGDHDVDRFEVEAGLSGYVRLSSNRPGEDRLVFEYQNAKGNYRGNPLLIPAKKGEIVSFAVLPQGYGVRGPFSFIASESKVADEHEPNDSLDAATSIDRSEVVVFSTAPVNDEDWFKISASGPSSVSLWVLDLFEFQDDRPLNQLVFELWDDTGAFVARLDQRSAGNGRIYSTPLLKKAGTYYLRAYSSYPLGTEHMFAMRMYGANLSGDPNDGGRFRDLYIIGFDLDSAANNAIQALSESAGAAFVQADTASLNEAMSEVFEDARKRKHSVWIYLLVALLVLVWVIRRRRKS